MSYSFSYSNYYSLLPFIEAVLIVKEPAEAMGSEYVEKLSF